MFASIPVLYWYSAQLLFPDTERQEETNKWDIRTSNTICVETVENTCSHSNLLTDKIASFRRLSGIQKLVIMYFLGYFVMGIALFSNFLPWT